MAIVPASIRNKNPGAQYPGASSKKFGSVSYETLTSKDGVHKIATFPTHVHGVAALFDLLDRAYTGMTIKAAITKWCGAYYVNTYIKVLEDKAGVKPDDTLTKDLLRDESQAIALGTAMAFQEAGQEYPLDAAGWQEGHRMAFAGGSVAPAFAVDNDVPSPKPETRAAMIAAARTRLGMIWTTVVGGVTWLLDLATGFASNLLVALKDLGPIKTAALEAGVNARAIGIAIAAGAATKVAAIYATKGK